MLVLLLQTMFFFPKNKYFGSDWMIVICICKYAESNCQRNPWCCNRNTTIDICIDSTYFKNKGINEYKIILLKRAIQWTSSTIMKA